MESLLKYPAVKDIKGKTIDRIIFRQMRISQLTILIFNDQTACYIIGQTISQDPVIITPIYYDNGEVKVLYTDLGTELAALDLLNDKAVDKATTELLKQSITEKASAIAEIEELEGKIKIIKSKYNI